MVRSGVHFAMDTPDAIPVGLNDYVVKGWCHSETPLMTFKYMYP